MSLSHWDEGSDSNQVRGVDQDVWLVGHCKIPAWQSAKLPRCGREGTVEVHCRSLPRRDHVSLRRKGSQVKQ